jgi:hypothetical protein
MKHQQYIVCNRDGTWQFRNGEPVLKSSTGEEVAIFNCKDSVPLQTVQTGEVFFYVKEDNVAWDMDNFKRAINKVKELNKV